MYQEAIFRIDVCEIEYSSDGTISWSLDLDSQSRTYESLVAGVLKIFTKILKYTKVDSSIEIKSLCRVENNFKQITLALESDDASIATELASNFRYLMRQASAVFDLASKMANDGADPAYIRIIEKDNNSIRAINNEISAPRFVAALATVMRKSTFDKSVSFATLAINLQNEEIIYTIPHGQDKYVGDNLFENQTCIVNYVNDKQLVTQVTIERSSVCLTFGPEQREILISSQKEYRPVDISWQPNHKIVDGDDQVTNGTLIEVAFSPCIDGL